jgi:hypothetical protein
MVTSLHLRKLHGQKENTAAALLAVCVLAGIAWQWIYMPQY